MGPTARPIAAVTFCCGWQRAGGHYEGGQCDHASSGVALDATGNLYMADRDNQRIREVSGGIITTVAGNGSEGLSGDGGPAIAAQLNHPAAVAIDVGGNLFIADKLQ